MSNESIFEVQSLHDFIESLDILGFTRSALPDKKHANQLCYRFFHPHFSRDKPTPDDIYKLRTDFQSTQLKHERRMLAKTGGQLLNKLLNKKPRKERKVLEKKLTKLKLLFALQKQLDVMRNEPKILEYDMEIPAYMENNEMAGYYGNASIEDLKEVLEGYFPMYQEVQQEESRSVSVKVEEIQVFAEDPGPIYLEEVELGEMIEIQPEVTPKKQSMKRKYSKKQTEANKENQNALNFLHQELKDVLQKNAYICEE